MSLFSASSVACPACNQPVDVQAVDSVNADRRPALRTQILAQTFQQQDCPHCSKPFRLVPRFNYTDLRRRQWIVAAPLAALGAWRAQEERAQALFDQVYGDQAPDAARELAAGLTRRVTFGWPGVREKLLAGEHGLDDVTLELCKLSVLRSGTPAPLGAGTELRLLDVDGDDLVFGWLRAADESLGPVLRVARAVYDEIAADEGGDWADARASLDAGLFVDLNRLLIPQPDAATA
jgi:hypothetical protein